MRRIIIQSSINSFGSIVMAADGAGRNICDLTYIAMNAMAQSAMTFVGQSVGAKDFKNINKIVLICVGLVTIVGLTMGCSTYVLAEPLIKIFLPENPEAISYGRIRFLYICIPYFLCGIMEILSNAQRGMGLSTVPMITSLIGSCAFRLIWIYTVFRNNPTLEVLYLSYVISWFITILAHIVFYSIKLHMLPKERV